MKPGSVVLLACVLVLLPSSAFSSDASKATVAEITNELHDVNDELAHIKQELENKHRQDEGIKEFQETDFAEKISDFLNEEDDDEANEADEDENEAYKNHYQDDIPSASVTVEVTDDKNGKVLRDDETDVKRSHFVTAESGEGFVDADEHAMILHGASEEDPEDPLDKHLPRKLITSITLSISRAPVCQNKCQPCFEKCIPCLPCLGKKLSGETPPEACKECKKCKDCVGCLECIKYKDTSLNLVERKDDEEEDEYDDEDIDALATREKRKAWGPRIRIPNPVRVVTRTAGTVGRVATRTAGTVGRVATRTAGTVGRVATRTARTVGNVATRTVRTVGTGIVTGVNVVGGGLNSAAKWTGGTLKGVVNEIKDSKIAQFIGNGAKMLWDFVKCFNPLAGLLEACGKEAISSIANSKGEYFTLGYSQGCMQIGGKKEVKKSWEYITTSAEINRVMGLKLKYFMDSGNMEFTLWGYVEVKPKIEIALEKKWKKDWYEKRHELAPPKTLFRKLMVLTVANVPIPVLIEIKVQPVVRIKVSQETTADGKLSFEFKEAAKISLDGITIKYDAKNGPTATASASHNLGNIQIVKTLTLNGKTTVTGTINVGPEIIISVNGVPVKLFPNLEVKAEGTIEATVVNTKACLKGGLKLSTSLTMFVIPDISKLTSVAKNFGGACALMVHTQCTYNPAVRAGNCAAKAFGGTDPCAKMQDGCYEMEKQLEKIPNPIANNPFLSKIDLIRKALQPIAFEKKKCTTIPVPNPIRIRIPPIRIRWGAVRWGKKK